MKVSKDIGDKRLSIYKPNEEEEELMGEVSDKIIDLIEEHGLNADQTIHLISALFVTMKEMHNIVAIEHEVDEKNPAHICMGPGCSKYLSFRGFCCIECHNKHYEEEDAK